MNLQSYLEETLSTEAIKKFGHVLFGSARQLPEQDTAYEKKIYKNITDWIKGAYMYGRQNNDIDNIIKELLDLQNQYPDVLKPDTTTLYRGVQLLSYEQFHIKKRDFKNLDNSYMISKKAYSIFPKSNIQSWTTDIQTAENFIKNEFYDDALVYKAIFSPNELLFNSNILYELAKADGATVAENEVIHFGNKPIDVQLIIKKTHLKYL